MTSESLQVVLHEGRNCVATLENLVLAIWGGVPRVASIRAIHDSHLELRKDYPCVGHFVLIHGPPRIPSSEARNLASYYSRRSRMSSIAVIIEGDGFWLSTARSFLTAVLFLRRSEAPTQVFQNIESALTWQERKLGEHAPKRALVLAALISLRDLSSLGSAKGG